MKRLGRAWLLALGHGLNDGYGSFITVLLPLIMQQLGLSLALGGLLASVRSTAASFTQLPFGALVDRVGPRWLILLGPAVTTTAMCLIGMAPSYGVLAGLLVAVGLGTAAFHPAAAAAVDVVPGRRGLAMSVFSAGGTIGAAAGPLVVGLIVGRGGLDGLPWLLVPAWGVLLILALRLKRLPAATPPKSTIRRNPNTPHLVRLWGMEVLKEINSLSYVSFLAVLWVDRGVSLTTAGVAVSVYSLSGTIGGLLAGRLSERIGRRRVIVGSLLAAVPFLYLFLMTDGWLSLVFMAVGAMFQLCSTPVAVVFAQELFPEHRGMVSGVLMGLGWGVGALLIAVVGYLGDLLGLETALGMITVLLLPAAAIAARLPKGTAPLPGLPHLPPGQPPS